MENTGVKIRLAKSFLRGAYCLKTDTGKRLSGWFKDCVERVAGDFVLLETDIGAFVYHKNQPELLFENDFKGECIYIYKLTEKIYCLETEGTDHAPWIWWYSANGDKLAMPVGTEVSVIKGNLIYARLYDGKCGVMDENLNWKILPCYDDIYDHIEGFIAGVKTETHTTDLMSIDENGKVSDAVSINGYIGEALTKELVSTSINRKYGVYNTKGEKILDIEYEDIWRRGNYLILKQKGLYGLADMTGKILYECKYYKISKTETGFELVTRQVTETTEYITV